MRRHRLARLSKLTQGAALVSVGALVACNTNGDTKHVNAPAPTEPIHVNATAEPAPTPSAAPSAAPSANPAASAPAQPSATTATAPTASSTAHPKLPRINAPPHFGNPPPPPKE
jgi:hypothetical protein